LTRRLLGQYFMLSLAGVFFCIALSLLLAWRGELAQHISIATLVPAVVLLLGAFALRKTVALNARIEEQLRQFSSPSGSADVALQPIIGADPAAVGWNAMLERMELQTTLTSLEAKLSQSLGGLNQGKLERVLNSLPDGVAVTDVNGRITLANNALGALAREKRDKGPVGQPIADLLALAKARDAETLREKFQQPTRPVVVEARFGDGLTDGVLRVARYPLPDANDATAAHVWLVRDITQQKLAEEMRNQFMFTATHELRTPLANIKAYAETLLMHDDIELEQQKQFYNTITSEATRLARFADELLNVSLMESGSLALDRHETDAQRMFEEVVEHVQPEAKRKRLRFEHSVPPKLPKLIVDKDKIAASLINLLGNAIKYTPDEGRVRLQVEATATEIKCHVEDTGIGIAPADIPKVFDKFFRSEDPRVRAITGSGLGLAFTQEVARLHGGCITVHSELNKGSRFTLSLPAG
jgi:two-component system phosphate regulon sensor histidine kinase PhoR